MKCLICEAPTKVVETRGDFRRRRCVDQHSYWTAEVLYEGVVARPQRPNRERPPKVKVPKPLKLKPSKPAPPPDPAIPRGEAIVPDHVKVVVLPPDPRLRNPYRKEV